jgi:8-oxo-dGTP pyrophosphatase MutT (NUDIX family)
MAAAPVERSAARVLVLDPDDRVLLLRLHPAAGEPYWITPGGGLEPGESHEQAARRELVEETGLRPDALHGPVHDEVADFEFEGVAYRQANRFFAARVGAGSVVEAEELSDVEQRLTTGWRWWSLAELDGTDETVYPETLPALLRGALAR